MFLLRVFQSCRLDLGIVCTACKYLSSKFYLVYNDPEHDPDPDHNYDPDPDLEHDNQESEVQMPEEEAFTVLVRIMQEQSAQQFRMMQEQNAQQLPMILAIQQQLQALPS